MSRLTEQFEQQFTESAERFRRMPRILRWGLVIAVAAVVFLFWHDYLNEWSKQLSAAADTLQRQRETVRNSDEMIRRIHRMEDTIRGAGEVQVPRPVATGGNDLHNVVNEILRKYSVTNDRFSMRLGTSIGRGPITRVTGEQPPQRLTAELRFHASPSDAAAIIAELESNPKIEAIDTLIMTRESNRRVSVRLNIETWVVDGPLQRPELRRGL